MRLVVDALVAKGGQAGLRTHALGLTRGLAGMQGLRTTVVVDGAAGLEWDDRLDVVEARLRRNTAVHRAAWRAVHMRRLVRRARADAVLVTSPEWPWTRGTPTFIWVHDLGPAMAPGLYGRARWLRYVATLGRTLRRCDGIFAVSNATKLDVSRWAGVERGRTVRVVPIAGQVLPDSGQLPTPVRGIGEFALYVGAFLPHKNVATLLEAWKDGAAGLPLVCVGPDYAGEKAQLLDPLVEGDWIVSPGFVEPSELGALYREARVVLLPSLFEGFGLPLAEAQQFGAPVIASRLPPYAGIARENVRFVDDPTSPDEWVTATRDVLTSRLRRNVPGRTAPEFSGWSEVARATVEGIRLTGREPRAGSGTGPL
ncbi:glycosyltransferase family 4 protein [Actinotalea fermentans]|uniref:Mannosyltransferase n=1 Tax=Actinotalea fermentans TaxID=43671 RepID=A0A511Z1F0_9CELL|nr:glycosyltransferase family 1 protein [Actinotalea fermentans]KGM17065.1 hypothetical protein N867_10560 [Actinotalea fermentans ATCC 43279 = JCM 9966 = DSM 3133]GEN81287.1 mannosyltransferase [Actinotalea fermentans]